MIDKKRNLKEELEKIDDNVIIKLEVVKETRSQAQNRLYWKWLTNITKVFADKGIFITTYDLHDGLKEKLLSYRKLNKLTGTYRKYIKSSTSLKKGEFSKYLDDIEKYLWQEFEISHPRPTDLFYNL